MSKDQLYKDFKGHIAPFAFDDKVVPVFQDMIQRSVPGYLASIDTALLLAQKVIQPHDLVYDLGCSLGATSLALSQSTHLPPFKIIGVDQSAAMINQLKSTLDTLLPKTQSPAPQTTTIELLLADINHIKFQPHRLSILNFVVQFIAQPNRQELLKSIFDQLLPGGCLLLSEKIAVLDSQQADIIRELHENFKALHGYTQIEIHNKREALVNVLTPETVQTHIDRLKTVGFQQVFVATQHLNFVSLVAFKS